VGGGGGGRATDGLAFCPSHGKLLVGLGTWNRHFSFAVLQHDYMSDSALELFCFNII